jgi:transcriptional regulator with XRE-family HTH domain
VSGVRVWDVRRVEKGYLPGRRRGTIQKLQSIARALDAPFADVYPQPWLDWVDWVLTSGATTPMEAWRIRRGRSQVELAELTRLPVWDIRALESGRIRWRTWRTAKPRLERIACVLGVEVAELFPSWALSGLGPGSRCALVLRQSKDLPAGWPQLQRWRFDRRLPLEELARQSHVPLEVIFKIEHGTPPNVSREKLERYLQALAHVFQLPLERLATPSLLRSYAVLRQEYREWCRARNLARRIKLKSGSAVD